MQQARCLVHPIPLIGTDDIRETGFLREISSGEFKTNPVIRYCYFCSRSLPVTPCLCADKIVATLRIVISLKSSRGARGVLVLLPHPSTPAKSVPLDPTQLGRGTQARRKSLVSAWCPSWLRRLACLAGRPALWPECWVGNLSHLYNGRHSQCSARHTYTHALTHTHTHTLLSYTHTHNLSLQRLEPGVTGLSWDGFRVSNGPPQQCLQCLVSELNDPGEAESMETAPVSLFK